VPRGILLSGDAATQITQLARNERIDSHHHAYPRWPLRRTLLGSTHKDGTMRTLSRLNQRQPAEAGKRHFSKTARTREWVCANWLGHRTRRVFGPPARLRRDVVRISRSFTLLPRASLTCGPTHGLEERCRRRTKREAASAGSRVEAPRFARSRQHLHRPLQRDCDGRRADCAADGLSSRQKFRGRRAVAGWGGSQLCNSA